MNPPHSAEVKRRCVVLLDSTHDAFHVNLASYSFHNLQLPCDVFQLLMEPLSQRMRRALRCDASSLCDALCDVCVSGRPALVEHPSWTWPGAASTRVCVCVCVCVRVCVPWGQAP